MTPSSKGHKPRSYEMLRHKPYRTHGRTLVRQHRLWLSSAVGQRIDGILQYLHVLLNGLQQRSPILLVQTNTRPTPLPPYLKASYLIASLHGAAREKIDELTAAQRENYDTVIAHLKNYYEGPHLANMARRALAKCKQEESEPAAGASVSHAPPHRDPAEANIRSLSHSRMDGSRYDSVSNPLDEEMDTFKSAPVPRPRQPKLTYPKKHSTQMDPTASVLPRMRTSHHCYRQWAFPVQARRAQIYPVQP
ncbi:unnamed protein product [Cylicocyclus nassatus]|uniref:Uncharacterized protein n=1 Tax=Cylicocyclus nassatus TaxID=53992 RepID=A0AA36GMH0_CYLNA|nr:unnamed protein product [Cylicocyclus nassatus]